MKTRTKLLSAAGLVFAIVGVCGGATAARAATRTIQFVGVAQNDPTTTEVSNWSTQSVCTLVIVNTGSSNQKIDEISFFRFVGNSTTTYTTTATQSSTKTSSYINSVLKSGSTSATTCIGQSIAQGGTCIVRFIQDTMPWTGRVAWCSGRLVVSDVSASSPGSMVASGSISIDQEAMVLGGMLSGAYYASGTHIQPLDGSSDWPPNMIDQNKPTTNAGGTGAIPSSYDTNNMNYLCAKACKAYSDTKSFGWTWEQCEEHCGMNCDGGTADGGWCRTMTGLVVPISTGLFKTTSPTSDPVSNATDYVRTSNPHFAGGMVYEMIVGPMVSICSGNRVYWEEGGVEFTHVDGVDSHAVYKANSTYSNAPPERLLCSHRHMKQEMFLRVGSTTPIVINGGLAF